MVKLWSIYEKSNVFKQLGKEWEKMERTSESASLFVSGMIVREVFCPQLDFCKSKSAYSFEQIWYCVCLFHNVMFERKEIWDEICKERNTYGKYSHTLNQTEMFALKEWGPLKVFCEPSYYYDKNEIIFTNGAHISKCRVSETEIKDYFHYRNACCKQGGMDHGIVGGLLLFEKMMNMENEMHYTSNENFYRNLYCYMANTLMQHNLPNMKQYKEKINCENDPLMWILLIAEAIEPLQYVKTRTDYKKVLNQIFVDVSERQIVFNIKKEAFDVDKYIRCLTELTDMIQMICEIDSSDITIWVRISNG